MPVLLRLAAALLFFLPITAQARDFAALVAALPEGSYQDRAAVAAEIAGSGDPRAETVLRALAEGDLAQRKSDGALVILARDRAANALTGAALPKLGRREAKKVRVNNTLRGQVRALLGGLGLSAADPARRAEAAAALEAKPDPAQLGALEAALARETDAAARDALALARAATRLLSDRPAVEKMEDVSLLADRRGPAARALLVPLVDDDALGAAATAALAEIDRAETRRAYAQIVWQGLSLGSVLLLAAIGLAITFGVMGVINMAHGELVMLGAYSTFAVQELFRAHAPHLFDWSLAAALPVAFLVAGGAGALIERGVVRFLYGRPLETLLATWGVSLMLQQAVRSIFGPNNREVGNPSWMSGSVDVMGLALTWNRVWIFLFALAVFLTLLLVMRRSRIGLEMRAVTQNRAMAAEMGIRTGRVDMLTFALGSGVAGLAGVALSQIDNVSPNLGQSYIVDSFMVVVFGGAGSLWGALAGALTLGVVNKFAEPLAGAMLAKVLILVFIILFIQKRPRGLFAARGRSVEA